EADGYGRMVAEAYEAWQAMWQDIGTAHYVNRGVLALSRSPGDQAEVLRRGLQRLAAPHEWLSSAEAAREYPFLDSSAFRCALRCKTGGLLRCREIARDLVDWLISHGARIRTGTRVAAVDTKRALVNTADGDVVVADRLIVACGAWTLRLFPQLGGLLRTFRTAAAYLSPPSDLRAAWAVAPAILDVGGSLDGYLVPPHRDVPLELGAGIYKRPSHDADAYRVPLADEGERLRAMFEPVIARIDDYQITDVVTCAYAFTPDERFFARAFDRAIVVSACSGHGYKFGAAVGQRLAIAAEAGDMETFVSWLRAEKRAEQPLSHAQ